MKSAEITIQHGGAAGIALQWASRKAAAGPGA